MHTTLPFHLITLLATSHKAISQVFTGFSGTCSNIVLSGTTTLQADCLNDKGTSTVSDIDLDNCLGNAFGDLQVRYLLPPKYWFGMTGFHISALVTSAYFQDCEMEDRVFFCCIGWKLTSKQRSICQFMCQLRSLRRSIGSFWYLKLWVWHWDRGGRVSFDHLYFRSTRYVHFLLLSNISNKINYRVLMKWMNWRWLRG